MSDLKLLSPQEFFNSIGLENTNPKNEEDYSIWINQGNEYSPAIKLKVKKELPKGVYKISFDNNSNNYVISPAEINTDEIYRFSESLTDKILNEVKDFWDRKNIYDKYNFTHKRGLLLEGPAGNSKTSTINLLIKQLLEQDGLIFVINSLREFQVAYDALPDVIRKIEPNRPIITIIEDVDQLINLNNGNDFEILDFLDGKHSINHHLVIMTSNDTSNLSTALLRPSRIDMRFVLDVPNKTIRREYLEKKGIPEDKLDEYAEKTKGMSFAQLKEVFISTVILGKDIDTTVSQINNPLENKDYLYQQDDSKLGI